MGISAVLPKWNGCSRIRNFLEAFCLKPSHAIVICWILYVEGRKKWAHLESKGRQSADSN